MFKGLLFALFLSLIFKGVLADDDVTYTSPPDLETTQSSVDSSSDSSPPSSAVGRPPLVPLLTASAFRKHALSTYHTALVVIKMDPESVYDDIAAEVCEDLKASYGDNAYKCYDLDCTIPDLKVRASGRKWCCTSRRYLKSPTLHACIFTLLFITT